MSSADEQLDRIDSPVNLTKSRDIAPLGGLQDLMRCADYWRSFSLYFVHDSTHLFRRSDVILSRCLVPTGVTTFYRGGEQICCLDNYTELYRCELDSPATHAPPLPAMPPHSACVPCPVGIMRNNQLPDYQHQPSLAWPATASYRPAIVCFPFPTAALLFLCDRIYDSERNEPP